MNRLIFNIAKFFYMAYVRIMDTPHLIWWKYQVVKYGGKENIPQAIKDKDVDYRVSKMSFDTKTEKNIMLSMQLGCYLKLLGRSVSDDDITLSVGQYLIGYAYPLPSYEEYVMSVVNGEYPIRILNNILLKEGVIKQHQIDFLSAKDDKLQKLLMWKNGEAFEKDSEILPAG